MGRNLRCSFCGKSDAEVARLIAGPKIYICDSSVAKCNAILAEHPPGSAKPTDVKADTRRMMALRRHLGKLPLWPARRAFPRKAAPSAG